MSTQLSEEELIAVRKLINIKNPYDPGPKPEVKEEIRKFFFFLPRIINNKFYWLVVKNVRVRVDYTVCNVFETPDYDWYEVVTPLEVIK